MKQITDYPISTGWHQIDNYHSIPHTGIDLMTPLNTKIYSEDSGVISLTFDQWLGSTIRLKLNNGETVVYGHISKLEVYDGEHVEQNQLLGLTGGAVGVQSSGQHTTGPHVHVSLYNSQGILIDPYGYLYHHQDIQQNNMSLLIYPILLILLIMITWRYRKYFMYSIVIMLMLIIIFIVS